jgi:hypothetical protein
MNPPSSLLDTYPCINPDSLSLGAHVRACNRARGRGFALQCVGERVHAVLGPRLVTTVLAATTLLALLAG